MFARMRKADRRRTLPLVAIAAPAFVATWSGWVGLGGKAGFGPVRLLPGIADDFVINSAITLPIGIEAYAAYALGVWLSSRSMSRRTRRFAMVSGVTSLVLGALGQVAYHLLETYGLAVAPWQIVVGVACLPIAIVGMTAALLHLLRADGDAATEDVSAQGAVELSRFDVDVFEDELPGVLTTRLAAVPVPAGASGGPVLPAGRDDAVSPGVPTGTPPSRSGQRGTSPVRRSTVVTLSSSRDDETVKAGIRAYRDEHGTWPSGNWVKTTYGGGHAKASRLSAQVQDESSREDVG
ncbi:MAG TPA: hypothetical protein VGL02_27330 [Streptomyces sp.]